MNQKINDDQEAWDGKGWHGGGAQEERNIVIIMTDSHFCMAEVNTTL